MSEMLIITVWRSDPVGGALAMGAGSFPTLVKPRREKRAADHWRGRPSAARQPKPSHGRPV